MEALEKIAADFCIEAPDQAALELERTTTEAAAKFLNRIPAENAAAVLARITIGKARVVLDAMELEAAGEIIDIMNPAIAANALRRMSADRRRELLAEVSGGMRAKLSLLIEAKAGSALALLDPDVFTLMDDWTVGEAWRHFRSSQSKSIYYLYVVDRDQVLQGLVPLRTLAGSKADTPIESLLIHDPTVIRASARSEAVASHSAWKDYYVLPVVDDEKRFLGVLRHDVVQKFLVQRTHQQSALPLVAAAGELYWAGLTSAVELTASLLTQPRKNGKANE